MLDSFDIFAHQLNQLFQRFVVCRNHSLWH